MPHPALPFANAGRFNLGKTNNQYRQKQNPCRTVDPNTRVGLYSDVIFCAKLRSRNGSQVQLLQGRAKKRERDEGKPDACIGPLAPNDSDMGLKAAVKLFAPRNEARVSHATPERSGLGKKLVARRVWLHADIPSSG